MKRFLLYGFIFFLSSIVACRHRPVKNPMPVSAIRVVDFRGKSIMLQHPAQRIVCLIESALSGLYMLGAENRVVGISSAVYYESVAPYYASLDERIRNKKLPAPGNWDFVNIENVIALQPDLVIIWSSQTESIEAIEERNIPVYGVFLKSFDDVHKEIFDLGILTGRHRRADSLNIFVRNMVHNLKNLNSVIDPIKVYYIWAQGFYETAGITSTVNEMIELAGAKNCIPVKQEHVVINPENLLKWNPDVIMLSFNCREQPEEIMNMKAWQSISAVQKKRIFKSPVLFYADLWTLKYPFAVFTLAKYCYPDAYKNIDADSIRINMIQKLYGRRGENLIRCGL